MSPSDTYTEVEEKVNEWLAAGTRVVLIIDPRSRTVTVYRSRTDIVQLTEADRLVVPDLLPGFACPVSELFRS